MILDYQYFRYVDCQFLYPGCKIWLQELAFKYVSDLLDCHYVLTQITIVCSPSYQLKSRWSM